MEIERKYLVNKQKWNKLPKNNFEHIVQGYLLIDTNKSIRVRIIGESAYLTIKGKTVNISREEYEFPIDKSKAIEIIDKFSEFSIEKNRYKNEYSGKIWVVDEFLGENYGLILSEIELNSENETFELPEWIDKEVSYDCRYYNTNLAKNPFKNWK